MGASEKVRNLRLVLGDLAPPKVQEIQPTPFLSTGIVRGTITELLGPARVEWIASFLKAHAEYQVFWCDKTQSVLPTALHQRGVNLSRVTFGLFHDDMLKPLRQILSSGLFQVVVAPNLYSEINTFKVLQLLAERGNANLFLLGGKEASDAWPISLQLEIHRATVKNEFAVEVLKQKHGLAN